MAIKLVVNGVAGAGKTDLLRTLGKETLVVSRDSKAFSLPLPHMLVDVFYDMTTLCYGGDKTVDGEKAHINGVVDVMENYATKFGEYPTNVAFDTVSQLFMDVIDNASQRPNVYGSQGAEVTKEMAIFTKFLHELELNGINIILFNHVIEEKADGKKTGAYTSFGSGKFLEKGGFYSVVNEAVTLYEEGTHRKVHISGKDKLARTLLEDIPDTMYVENSRYPDKSKKLKEGEEYYSLAWHMNKLLEAQQSVEEWSL